MKFMQKYFTPSQMGKVYVTLSVIGLFVVIVAVMQFLEPEKKERKKPPEIENIISDRNSREFGLDAVNDKVVGQTKLLNAQTDELEQLKEDNEALRKKVDVTKELEEKNRDLERKLEKLSSQFEAFQQESAEKGERDFSNIMESDQVSPNRKIQHPELKVNPERRKVAGTSFSYGNGGSTTTARTNSTSPSIPSNVAHQSSASVDKRKPELIAVIEDVAEIEQVSGEQTVPIRVPKGSILTGVLITGLDAPTASSASENPIPVLVRIKKEAILPNFATVQEVNECFAIMAGYGDLSTERAMLRGESITCVRHDKTVIEADFSSFAVGEDGKNGLKGTLVTRNSTVLANAMMAGFGAGLASMFDVNPVPVIATDITGQQQYQDVFTSDALTGGAAKGASEAMTKLADYYMELADSIHPVIEVGAGRVVDMVITQGVEL